MRPKLSQARGIGFSFFIYLIVYIVAQFVVTGIMASRGINVIEENNSWYLFAVSTLPNYIVGVPVFFLMTRKYPTKPVPVQKHISAWEMVQYLLMSLSIGYIFSAISNIINMPLVENFDISENVIADLLMNMDLIPIFVYVVILAPIFEELVFRKRFLDKAHAFGRKKAVLASGLAFGLFHLNLQQGIYTFALGVFWALMYFKTGRLSVVVILHMLMNFMGSIVMAQVLKTGSESAEMIAGVVVIVIIVLGLAFLIKNRKELLAVLEEEEEVILQEYEDPETGEMRVREIAPRRSRKTPSLIWNIGFMFYMVACVFMIVLTVLGTALNIQ